MNGPSPDVQQAARLLLQARTDTPLVALPAHCLPRDVDDAYRIQDATVAQLGAIGGWKVGAKSPDAEPTCAPIPASLLYRSGAVIPPAACRLRGAEAEIAVRFRRDLPPRGTDYSREEVAVALAAVLPAIELADARFEPRLGQPPLAALADCGGNSGLVLGEDCAPVLPSDLARQGASMRFDGEVVAQGRGAHSGGDLLRLLTWLANHVAQRAGGLRAGDVVTTGTWTGVLFAPPGAWVQAELDGLGRVECRFG